MIAGLAYKSGFKCVQLSVASHTKINYLQNPFFHPKNRKPIFLFIFNKGDLKSQPKRGILIREAL